MPLATVEWGLNEEVQQEEPIIQSMFWDLPESTLDGWRPFTATLLPSDLYGPVVGHGHGIDFRRPLMFAFNGPRGAAKTCSLSYVLAKLLRAGYPVWTNYPISFYVAESGFVTGGESREYIRTGPCQWSNRDGTMSYYESMPLDMDKFYSFHRAIRHGAVGIDELQYFVEARTSGRYQNRVLGYQIMQIRKTANSFGYTVQNQKWVDNRFGWSSDWQCECYDVSKKTYDRRGLGRVLEEGEVSHWIIRDISGVLTGTPYEQNGRVIGPYQFDSKRFWGIYPTHYIIDVFEAMKGPDRDKAKKDKQAQIVNVIEAVANQYIEQGVTSVSTTEFLDLVKQRLPEPLNNTMIGRIMGSMGIKATVRGYNKRFYDFSDIIEATRADHEETT